MTQHIAKVTSSCFYQLRRLSQIRRPVRVELVAQQVHSFVLSRLDYGNSILAALPKSAIMPLQCVQNAAARLILDLYGWTNTWHQLWGSSTGCPSTGEWTSNCALWCTQSTGGQCPTYSSDMVRAIAVNQMRSDLRSVDTAQYIKPRCHTEIGKRAFSYAGPIAKNDFPLSLHCNTDVDNLMSHQTLGFCLYLRSRPWHCIALPCMLWSMLQ